MAPTRPPTVSTAELSRLLAGPAPPWLVYAPDHAGFQHGHIAGSLSAGDQQLVLALPRGADVVTYGEHDRTRHARALAVALRAAGHAARWYDGGLRAWAAAGLPVDGA